VCPGVEGIAAEPVDGDDTKVRLRLAKLTNKGKTTASGSSGGTYSMAGDVVASFGGYAIDNAIRSRAGQATNRWITLRALAGTAPEGYARFLGPKSNKGSLNWHDNEQERNRHRHLAVQNIVSGGRQCLARRRMGRVQLT
jgi:hypothetical protein